MVWAKVETITKALIKYRILVLIVILAFSIRVYKVSQIPYGFDGDEAAFGYYAYSLVNSLSDEYGNKLPFYFPSIGDYKYPVYSYLSTVPISIFGLSIFSTRLLSVLAGSLLPAVIYFLTIELFNKKNVGVIAALLTAVSPYSILFSRGAYESNVATFFLTLGLCCFFYSLRKQKIKYFYLSFVPTILAIYSYSSTRVFLLLFLPAVYIISIVQKTRLNNLQKRFLQGFVGFVVLIVLFSFIDPRSRVRANDVGFLRDAWPSEYLETSIHEDGLALEGRYIFITRAFHNKIFANGISIARRFFEHFDPVYLFAESNPNLPKYSIPNFGLFYYFEFITILFGIYALSRMKKSGSLVMGLWALLSVVPSSLSIETPNPVRALIGLPALIILSAVGVWYFYDIVSRKYRTALTSVLGFILVFHFAYFWHQYSIHGLYHQPWYTDGGVGEMVSAVGVLEEQFEKVVVTDDPYIFFLFYNKVIPQEFLKDSEINLEKMGEWERVERFGKVIFKMPYDCPKIGRENVLYVCKGEEIPQNSILHKVVRFKDGKPAFLLLEFIPYSERQEIRLPERVHLMKETDLNFPEGLLPEDADYYW